MPMIVRFLLVFVLLWPVAARADAALTPGPWVQIADVVDGDTVRLTPPLEGAALVRLVGVQAPEMAHGRPGFVDDPFGPEARAVLVDLVGAKRVQLLFGDRRKDRHGRHLAHLFLEDGTWVQGEMLRRGAVRVYSFPDNRARVADMLALEGDARAANRGLWAEPAYRVRDALDVDRLLGDLGQFHLVEGVVHDAARVKGTVYLNFADDWRRDFTIRIEATAARLFKDAGIDPLAFKGQRVRVRGWLDRRNGPEVRASHPEQIEIVR